MQGKLQNWADHATPQSPGRAAYEFNCSTLRLRRPYQFFSGFTFDIIILNILFFSFFRKVFSTFLLFLSFSFSLCLWEAAQEAVLRFHLFFLVLLWCVVFFALESEIS